MKKQALFEFELGKANSYETKQGITIKSINDAVKWANFGNCGAWNVDKIIVTEYAPKFTPGINYPTYQISKFALLCSG